jgi:periplasmic divalent cation tolerance protein
VDPSTDDLCEVTITAPDADWLAEFVRDLVERRLCAAGHITTSIRSIYRWQSQVYDRPEAVAKLHTRRDRVDEVARLADERHPYEVPCVVAVPFVAGGRAYLEWITTESSDSARLPRDDGQ